MWSFLHIVGFILLIRKSPTYEPLSCELSKMQTSIHMSSHVSELKVAQSCLTLCSPVDYTVYRIPQARILESVAFPFSRGSSQPRDRTQVSRIEGEFFTSWAKREAQEYWSGQPIPSPADFPDPRIAPGSTALQADSLPTELSGKSCKMWVKL